MVFKTLLLWGLLRSMLIAQFAIKCGVWQFEQFNIRYSKMKENRMAQSIGMFFSFRLLYSQNFMKNSA